MTTANVARSSSATRHRRRCWRWRRGIGYIGIEIAAQSSSQVSAQAASLRYLASAIGISAGFSILVTASTTVASAAANLAETLRFSASSAAVDSGIRHRNGSVSGIINGAGKLRTHQSASIIGASAAVRQRIIVAGASEAAAVVEIGVGGRLRSDGLRSKRR
jgi:hypothetical protein